MEENKSQNYSKISKPESWGEMLGLSTKLQNPELTSPVLGFEVFVNQYNSQNQHKSSGETQTRGTFQRNPQQKWTFPFANAQQQQLSGSEGKGKKKLNVNAQAFISGKKTASKDFNTIEECQEQQLPISFFKSQTNNVSHENYEQQIQQQFKFDRQVGSEFDSPASELKDMSINNKYTSEQNYNWEQQYCQFSPQPQQQQFSQNMYQISDLFPQQYPTQLKQQQQNVNLKQYQPQINQISPQEKSDRIPLILENSVERVTGVLKYFDPNKNYGFIVIDKENKEIFFHLQDISNESLNREELLSFKNGNIIRVSFIICTYIGKYNVSKKAIDIQPLGINSINE